MNKLLIQLLPKDLIWLDQNQFRATRKDRGFWFEEVLIGMEKHGNDLDVVVGYIRPKDNYQDFDLFKYAVDRKGILLDQENVLAICRLNFYQSMYGRAF